MIRVIYRVSAEQWHHDCLHHQFEHDPERNADGDAPDPTLGPHVTNLAPGRAREPHPHQRKNGAEGRHQEIAREDNENRENSERPESAQGRGGRAFVA